MHYIFTLFVFAFCFFPGTRVPAQTCPSADLTLATQEELDDFIANFPNCDKLDNLTITGSVKNLTGLPVTNVTENLSINAFPLNSLDGLKVISVGDDLTIRTLDLTNGLSTTPLPLETVGRRLTLGNLRTVLNLQSFSNLTQARDISLDLLRDLKNLDGLDLNDVTSLFITDNDVLEDISALTATAITRTLVIENNPNLSTCNNTAVCTAISTPISTVTISNNAGTCVDLATQAFDCDPQLAVLLDFYNDLNGPGWDEKVGWSGLVAGINFSPCDGTWTGVTCNGAGKITELRFTDNDMAGPLATKLDPLTELRVFRSFSNPLTGTVPDHYFDLPNLEEFGISGANLTGGIPRSVENGSRLKLLTIDNSFPSGGGEIPVEITRIPTLQFLTLRGNNLSGEIPAGMDNLQNLVFLDLQANNLKGDIPRAIGNLLRLESLALDLNDFTSVSDLGNLSELRLLGLGRNSLSAAFPFWITRLTALQRLRLDGNDFTGPVPEEISDLVDLEVIDLNFNSFTGPVPVFPKSSSLVEYQIARNEFSGGLPDGMFGSNTGIETFIVSFNNLDGPLPESFGNWTNASSVSFLNNDFSNCYPASYTNFCTGFNIPNFNGNPNLPSGGSTGGFFDFCSDGVGSCALLPVTWLNFEATATPKAVQLHWQTTAEENNAGFHVERSTDGRRWQALEQVAALGGFGTTNDYHARDTRPVSGTNYYRIRQTDFDGTIAYSPVAQVDFNGSGSAPVALPSPFTEQLTVFSEQPDQVAVFNLTGQKVAEFRHAGGGAQVQRLLLESGVYLLRFGGSGVSLRIVKK